MPAPKGNRHAAGNKGGGRPTIFKKEHVSLVEKVARLGATNVEIAGILGVSETTIETWTANNVEFSEALKRGKLIADAEVADKLYRRATGYSHKAVKIVADAKTGAEHIVPYTEHYPPDTTAAIFWLKNRRRAEWRDKQEHEVTGANGGPLETITRIELVPVEPKGEK